MMMVVVVMLGRRWLVDAQRIGRHDRPAQVSIKLLNAVETSRTAASLFQQKLLLRAEERARTRGPIGRVVGQMPQPY